jgi:HAMP domain-containing protein
MVLGRSLDPAAVEAISEQARVALTVMPAGAPDLSPEEAVLLARLEPRTVPHIVETERLLQIYSVLPDLYGTPAVLLRVDVPRTILAQGRHTFAHAILSTLMVGLGVLLLLTAVLRRSVLKPLRRITEHAVVIGQRDDLRSRLTLDRKDELGVLAGELDRMVERLAEARRRLIDQSYHAGIAEMASGVLHNIGNAITPLCERVSTLDEALRAAPTAEMEMAVTELGDATTPPERRTDLARFVELAGCDLAALVTRTREEMAAIAHQVTHIQQILTDQERYSRAARVLEPVDVEQVVRGGRGDARPADAGRDGRRSRSQRARHGRGARGKGGPAAGRDEPAGKRRRVYAGERDDRGTPGGARHPRAGGRPGPVAPVF